MDRIAIRRVAQKGGLTRPSVSYSLIWQTARQPARSYSSAQNVTSISFWKSLVPKPLRRENRLRTPKSSKKSWLSGEWNPATFYIIIFLMIGSMSIQMISLRKNFEAYMRRSEVRIGLLREVVEKLQNGEQVDVEKMLGTGDAEREAEWEEVMNEIEKDSAIKNPKKQEKSKAMESPVSNSAAKLVTAWESKVSNDPAKESPNGRTANFF